MYRNSLFPLKKCKSAVGTSPERATPYRWPAAEVTLALFAGAHVGKDSVNMELGNGVLAFDAQEEVAGAAAVHKSVLGQAACAGRVLENVEGGFLIRVAVHVIEAHPMSGQVLQGGLAKMVRKNIAWRLARGCVAAPAFSLIPSVTSAGSIDVDGNQADVPAVQFGANTVDSAAALGQRNVFVFRNQEGSVEVLGLKGGHDSPGNFPVVGPFEETAVRGALSCSFPAVSVVN